MATIAVYNPCAGVGKTTTALNLLAAFALHGTRPLAIDLDPQGELTAVFDAQPRSPAESLVGFFRRQAPLDDIAQITRSGVIVCPAHGELARLDALLGKSLNAVTRLRGALRASGALPSAVVIDCGSAHDVLSLNALFACDLVLVPLSPDGPARQGALAVERILNALEPVFKRRLPRRYLFTRTGPQGPPAAEIAVAAVAAVLPPQDVCHITIREDAALARSRAAALDVFRHDPASRGAEDYAALLTELEPLLPVTEQEGNWRQ
jgi:chromosome partitioning protein